MPVLKPSQQWVITPAEQAGQVAAQRVLLIGQMLSGGTASDGLIQNIGNDNSWDTLFGARSQLAGMCRKFRAINEVTDLDVICVSDAGGATQGTAVITITGTASAAGTLYFSAGSETDHKMTITIASGDTADEVGTALAAAFTADTKAPFTAANVSGAVTLTAENGGTLCNDWSVKVSGSVAGLSVALTGWTGGATDPTLTSILDPIANIRYQTIVWPNSTWDEADLTTLLDSRFSQNYKIMDGVGICTKVGSAAQCVAYADQNSQSFVVFGNKAVSRTELDGAAIPEMSAIISTHFAAIRALRYTDDVILTQFQTTTAGYDQFGGAHIRSLPYFNTRMYYLPEAEEIDEFTLVEMNETLEGSGVSVVSSNRTYNAVILGAVVTTYLNNAAGNPDDSFKYLNYVDAESYIREYFYESFRASKGQNRLTNGAVADGYAIDNEGTIRAFCLGLYQDLADLQLTERGKTAEKDFLQNLTVTLDISTGKVTILMAPLLVGQLRLVIGAIQVKFSS